MKQIEKDIARNREFVKNVRQEVNVLLEGGQVGDIKQLQAALVDNDKVSTY